MDWQLPGFRGREERERPLNGDRVLFWGDKKVWGLEMVDAQYEE